jgi:hypothetical protein
VKHRRRNLFPQPWPVGAGIAFVILGTQTFFWWLVTSAFSTNWVELDDPRRKGVAVYHGLECPPLPAGAVCIKADYAGQTYWHYRFLFWLPSEPSIPPPLSKRDFLIDILNLKNRMDDVSGSIFPLQNPRNGFQWHWPGSNGMQYRLENVQCDDGYYLYAEVHTIAQESR